MARGSLGITGLVMLIVFVLVAAIAASIIITSNGYLKNQALKTGKMTKDSLTQNVQIKEISASDGRDGSIDHFYILLKPMAGSNSIRLNRMVVTLTKTNQTLQLSHKNGTCTPNQTTGYYTIK